MFRSSFRCSYETADIAFDNTISQARDKYRYIDLSGKKRTIYAVMLEELREKEKQMECDLQDGIDSHKGDMTLNQLFQVYMETRSGLRENNRCNYLGVWKTR